MAVPAQADHTDDKKDDGGGLVPKGLQLFECSILRAFPGGHWPLGRAEGSWV